MVGNGTKSGATWNTDNTQFTFTFSDATLACQFIQINYFGVSNGLTLNLSKSATGSSSTACDPGPASGNSCYIKLDATGVATYTMAVSNSSGSSFTYILVGPAWSSAPLGGQATVTFTGVASPTPTPTPTPTSTSTAVPNPTGSPSVGGTLNLLWSDEFSGTSGSAPDSTKWFNTTGDGCAAPDSNCGWGNGEQQWYTPSANTVDGSTQGNLLITANRLSSSSTQMCYYGKCSWSSGKMTTKGKAGFTYGYLEARVKGPAGNGNWPAFWMLGTDIYTNPWPRSGEIDIYEVLGSAQTTNWGTAHFADAGGGHIQGPGANTWNTGTNTTQTFHTYGILWKPGSITWYFDGAAKGTARASDYPTSQWPFGKTASDTPTFYAILNNAMGGAGGGIDSNMNSSTMTVDYVRYYSVDGVGRVTTY